MHAQIYFELVLGKCGIPSPRLVCHRYSLKNKSPIDKLLKLSLSAYLETFGEVDDVSEEELEFIKSWAGCGFPGINKLPELILFRLFQIVQPLGLRVECVFYGMHTMFTIRHKFTRSKTILVSHQDYDPIFWKWLEKRTKRGQIRQPMVLTISGNPIQRLSIPLEHLQFFANHPKWHITISNAEIALEAVDGYVLFAKNITFETCFFKTENILKHFCRIGNCRFCGVTGSPEHIEWLVAREENCEL